MQTCKEWFSDGLKRYGYSAVELEVKAWNRRRVPEDRPARQKFSWSEYKRLYDQQKGMCPLCQGVMPLIRGKIEMDHVNVELIGEAFNARSNRQVVCKACNREKAALTVMDQTKRYGRTMNEILLSAGGQGDDTPIADGGMAEDCP